MNLRDQEELRYRISQAKEEVNFEEHKLDQLTSMLKEQEAFMKKYNSRLEGSNAWMPIKTATLWLKDEQLSALVSYNAAKFNLGALIEELPGDAAKDGGAPRVSAPRLGVMVGPGPMPR